MNCSCFNWIQWRKQLQTHSCTDACVHTKRQSRCNIRYAVVVVVILHTIVSLDQASSKFTYPNDTNHIAVYFLFFCRFDQKCLCVVCTLAVRNVFRALAMPVFLWIRSSIKCFWWQNQNKNIALCIQILRNRARIVQRAVCVYTSFVYYDYDVQRKNHRSVTVPR